MLLSDPLVSSLLSPHNTAQSTLSLPALLSYLKTSDFGADLSSGDISAQDMYRTVRLRADSNQITFLVDFKRARILAAGVGHGDAREIATAWIQRKDSDRIHAWAESRIIAVRDVDVVILRDCISKSP